MSSNSPQQEVPRWIAPAALVSAFFSFEVAAYFVLWPFMPHPEWRFLIWWIKDRGR